MMERNTAEQGTSDATVDAVVIGRNEGARLLACLAALQGRVRRLVYVDSGSTDGSVAVATAAGAEVVGAEDADRQSSRQRWKFYQERGYAIRRHDAAAREPM